MENFSTHVGLDLGDVTSVYHMLDKSGKRIGAGKVKTSPDGLTSTFASVKKPAIFAIEVGRCSRWVEQTLRSMGFEVVVANPRKLQAISQNDRKSDAHDAELLAKLVRVDRSLLHPVQHRSNEAQAALSMLKCRETLVRARTQLINTVRAVCRSTGVMLPSCDAHGFHKRVRELVPDSLQPALKPILDTLTDLSRRINAMDKDIERMADKNSGAKLLQSVRGVGPITSLAFVLTIDDPKRFKKSRDVAAYLGLVPKRDQSGGHDPQLHISKSGDELVRLLLVSCAYYIMRRGEDSALRQWGLALKKRGGRAASKRAAVAMARKLATMFHAMMTTGELFNPWPGGAPTQTQEAA